MSNETQKSYPHVSRFSKKLITEWRRLELPFADETLVVGVSGGADSVALLFALKELTDAKKLKHRLITAHFNHALRGNESDADEDFVRYLCAQNNIEFTAKTGKIAKKGNLEQNARESRYKFLTETAEKNNAKMILTAHTMNDQAETFLMNLVRGSGIDGLSAMRQIAKRNEIKIVRPLIFSFLRKETEEFCSEKSIEFRTDRMNLDPNFTRVRIRREIIPKLSELNQKIIETLVKTSRYIPTEMPLETCETLTINNLQNLDVNTQLTVIRGWLRTHCGSLRGITSKHLESIRALALSTKSGRKAELPKRSYVLKQHGELFFRKDKG